MVPIISFTVFVVIVLVVLVIFVGVLVLGVGRDSSGCFERCLGGAWPLLMVAVVCFGIRFSRTQLSPVRVPYPTFNHYHYEAAHTCWTTCTGSMVLFVRFCLPYLSRSVRTTTHNVQRSTNHQPPTTTNSKWRRRLL